MATEDQSSPAEQVDNANEPVEQIQQEDILTTETEAEVGAGQEENKILTGSEPRAEEIQQGEAQVEEDKIITETQVEQIQIQQADKAQVSTEQEGTGGTKTDEKIREVSERKQINESDEKAKRMQQENEITYPDEKIQSIVDLDKAPSIKEDASIITNQQHISCLSEETSFEVATLDSIKIDDQEFQAAVFGLECQFPFSSPDGLVTPPPTPTLAESSHVLAESSEHDTNECSTGTQTSRGTKTSQKSKSKKKKHPEFKIECADPRSSAYSENRVITGVRDEEREKQIAECSRYAGVEKYASIFVDSIIDQSIEKVAEETMIRGVQLEEEEVSLTSLQTFVEVFGNFTKWPRIREFSKETGEAVIEEFIQTWEYEEDWMYCIDFLLEQSDECSEYYLYEVKWSIPSKPYPIPQATASVYFTIEVSRVKPDYCPVDVTYVFEGSKLNHAPGKIPFQEHWLFGIIDAKLEMYKQIRF